MIKRKMIVFFAAMVVGTGAMSADEKSPVDLELGIATDYLWRGYDVYAGKLLADGKTEGVFNFAPSLMPSLTFYAPIEGLSFNLWMARSLVARDGASGGLGAADEIDYTASYEFSSVIGDIGAAMIYYTYPTTMGGSLLSGYFEAAFSYSIPVILSPSFGVAFSDGVGGDTAYYTIGLSHELGNDTFSFEPGVTFGYWYFNGDVTGNKMHLDISLPFGYSISESFGVSLSLTGSYRITDMYDGNAAPFVLAAYLGASYSL